MGNFPEIANKAEGAPPSDYICPKGSWTEAQVFKRLFGAGYRNFEKSIVYSWPEKSLGWVRPGRKEKENRREGRLVSKNRGGECFGISPPLLVYFFFGGAGGGGGSFAGLIRTPGGGPEFLYSSMACWGVRVEVDLSTRTGGGFPFWPS